MSASFGMDHEAISIDSNLGAQERTTRLEVAKNQLVRSQVIMSYTLVDEFLNMQICPYFFGRKRRFIYLWNTKKFQRFNHHILEELYLLQKLRFVKSFKKIPKSIEGDIQKLNALRNGLAHAFFPENLKKSKPEYKGKNIFTLQGIQLFMEDMHKLWEFFMRGEKN